MQRYSWSHQVVFTGRQTFISHSDQHHRNSQLLIIIVLPRLSQFILQTAPFRGLYRWSSRIHPPGFHGLSLYTVTRFLFKEIRVNKLNVRGAAVTYNFFMAIPPTLLFFCSLIPYLPGVDALKNSILRIVEIVSPPDAHEALSKMVIDLIDNEQRGVLSFGILLTLFFSSNGMMGLMRSFDRQSSLYKKRSALKRRWTAIKLTLMVLLVGLLTMVALVLQSRMLNDLLSKLPAGGSAIRVFSLLLVLLLIFLSICMVYRYGPSLTHKWKFISPGSILATFGCVLLTTIFFFLVDNVIHYNKVYGSIGSLMAFMVWLFLNTQVILLGFELNMSILLGKLEKEEKDKFEASARLEQP